MAAGTNTQAERPSFLIPHAYPGRLISAEGLDGSGKSTQLRLLQFWLQAEGYESKALESFRMFEMKMYSEYQQMQKAFGFTVIEGNQSIDQIQSTLRRAVMRLLLDV